jgi:hypothetical protein
MKQICIDWRNKEEKHTKAIIRKSRASILGAGEGRGAMSMREIGGMGRGSVSRDKGKMSNYYGNALNPLPNALNPISNGGGELGGEAENRIIIIHQKILKVEKKVEGIQGLMDGGVKIERKVD